MEKAIRFRAIYENGVLRPLKAIDLPEGTEVILILEVLPKERSRVFRHIVRDPEALGGRAHIEGTAVRVMDIVRLER